MRHARFTALLVGILLAAAPASAQRGRRWMRSTAARTPEAALAPGVRVTRSTPADVDGDGTEDALLELEREGTTERALAVARRQRGRWQVLPTTGAGAELPTEWVGAFPAGGRIALVARRHVCGNEPCVDVLHVFHLEARAAEAAGNIVGERGETLTAVAVDATSAVAQTDRGRSRALALDPDSGSLWLGPWAASAADALRARPIALGMDGELALAGARVGVVGISERGGHVMVATYGPDGAPDGPPVDTGITFAGWVVHATPAGDGWSITLENDHFSEEDEDTGSATCESADLERWSWSPRGARRVGTLRVGSECDTPSYVASGPWLGLTIDASGVRWIGPGSATIEATPIGPGGATGARLVGAGPDGFLVARGDAVTDLTRAGVASTVAPFGDATLRSCVGTERAWACHVETPAGPRLAVRPHGPRGLPAALHQASFTHLDALPGDRVLLRHLNTYDGGGHVAVFNVIDLASGRVGPAVELGRGFVEDVVADQDAIYVRCSTRLHRIPWAIALPAP